MLDKSRGLNVDCVTYDLEDSVTPQRKAEARSNIRRFLQQPRSADVRENAVRINAVQTGLALDDLTEVVRFLESKAPSTCGIPGLTSVAQSAKRRHRSRSQSQLSFRSPLRL